MQPLFFPNAKDRITASNKGNIKQAKSKQGSAKKSNFGEPPRGGWERGGLGCWALMAREASQRATDKQATERAGGGSMERGCAFCAGAEVKALPATC